MYVYKPSWMWAICIQHISSLSAPGLVGCNKKVHVSFKKNPPVKFSGYRPVLRQNFHYHESLIIISYSHEGSSVTKWICRFVFIFICEIYKTLKFDLPVARNTKLWLFNTRHYYTWLLWMLQASGANLMSQIIWVSNWYYSWSVYVYKLYSLFTFTWALVVATSKVFVVTSMYKSLCSWKYTVIAVHNL